MKTDRPVLVVDLEATCWSGSIMPDGRHQTIDTMEIIEFGCALTNRNGELLDSRSFLVRPIRSPQLSDFCTSLTSITQSMIDEAPVFPEAVRALNEWLDSLPEDFIWCSWGNYDRLHVLAESQKHRCIPRFMAYPHLNLKRIWRRTTGQKRKNGFAHALEFHELAFEGHHHRGVDDARNMVRLLPFMDWALEADLLTHPGLERLKGCIPSHGRVVSIEAMDRAIRGKSEQ